MEILNLKERPSDALSLQLLSGEGQVALIKNYKDLFDKENIRISQVLLTHHNFLAKEKQAITKILNSYLERGVIPIINENDLINKEELEKNKIFTDNDILAAIISTELKVDLAIILTDVDGLFTCNPSKENAIFIEKVEDITKETKKLANGKGNLGKGGMHSKIIAAEMMCKEGIEVIVGNGNKNILDLISNKERRTIFKKNKKKINEI